MTFTSQVISHQIRLTDNIQSRLIGIAAKKLLGIELTLEQLAYLTCLVHIKNNKQQEHLKSDKLQVPVQYLFSLMTSLPSTDYTKRNSYEYMATITHNCIEPLSSLVMYTPHDKGKCREFHIQQELIDAMDDSFEDVLEHKELPIEQLQHNSSLGIKPAKWGGYCLSNSHLPPLTKTTWRKLRDSQFIFDIELFNSSTGKAFINSLNMNKYQRRSLIQALSGMLLSSKPQYHDSFYIQQAGRLHTKGGPMNLNSKFRRYFIKPLNPSNITLEVDLKCAQLLILCDLLVAPQTKQEIVSITNKDSIWNHIGPNNIPKEIKKVIVYGFCFGASISDLPYLASYKASVKHNLDCSVTKEDVLSCFSGILTPLIELRDMWMNQYSTHNITSGSIDKAIHTNALGLKFNLNVELKSYREEQGRKQLNPLKVASRLLAFYSQGAEQILVQSLLSLDCVSNNILTYSYDGFSLEVSNPKYTISTFQSYLDSHFPSWSLDTHIYS